MKYLLLIFSVFLLVGCSVVPDKYPDVPKGEDPKVLASWMSFHIKYKSDPELYGHEDYWASKWETYQNRAGDCEDKAYFFNLTMYENTGICGHYEVYWISSEGQYHLVAYFQGYRFGYIEGSKYIQDYSFEYVDRMIGHYSDRSLRNANDTDNSNIYRFD
jgi:hypothetical protein